MLLIYISKYIYVSIKYLTRGDNFMRVLSASPVLITILVVLGTAILGFGIFLLYHFVISRNSYKKQLRDLERKYSYLDALLIGQDSQYIHRLEIISRTNLLFVEKYNMYSRRFKEVFDGDDKFAESMIKQMKALIANSQYKNMKIVLADTKKAIAAFEESVNQLDQELYEIIKPEEEAKHTILQLKENYRRVKQLFYANSSDLELVSASFTQVFDKLDESFSNFEVHIEGGEYEEAQAIIPVIRQVVTALDTALATLPTLCILVAKIVPEKINQLSNEFNEIEKRGIPLFNLSFYDKVDAWNASLVAIRKRLISLQIGGVKEEIDRIQDEIEAMRASLEKELADKNDFSTRCDALYGKVISLEKQYVKICSILPEIRQVYVVTEGHEAEITKLNEHINRMGSSKRTLDNFINSGTKQPFSVLKTKLDELQADYDAASDAMAQFKAYIEGLKNSSEEAYTLVFAYYYRCKQIESNLRILAIPSFAETYKEQIEACYALLNEIDSTLKVKPINVEDVNTKVEQLKNTANVFFDEVDNRIREAQLAESAIVFANRDRKHQMDLHQRLNVLEKQFYNGDFVKVYHDARDLYRRSHVEEIINGGK